MTFWDSVDLWLAKGAVEAAFFLLAVIVVVAMALLSRRGR